MASTYGEIVGERASRWDGTLRDPCRAIHLCGAILKETMEMERSALVSQLIVHVDDEPVAHCGFNHGDRPLAIDSNHRASIQAVWIC